MSAETTPLLLKVNLKQLKLPTMLAEWEKLAREAAAKNEAYESYLLRLTEAEVTTRSANALAARIRAAGFPVLKDFDTFDFARHPVAVQTEGAGAGARGSGSEEHSNCCLIGNAGTGKTHLAVALGLAICRLGKRVRFVTAAGLVTQLEEAQQQHRLDRLLTQLDRARPVDHRRVGLPVVQPRRGGVAVPGVRGPLRTAERAGDEQPGVQRMGQRVPGRPDDGGAVGPSDASASHTILKSAPIGTVSKRERVHLVHHPHLMFPHLDPFHQCPDHLPDGWRTRRPPAHYERVGRGRPTAEQFPEVRLGRLSVPHGGSFRLQPVQTLPGSLDPRLELGLVQQGVRKRVDQPGHPSAGRLDQSVG